MTAKLGCPACKVGEARFTALVDSDDRVYGHIARCISGYAATRMARSKKAATAAFLAGRLYPPAQRGAAAS